MDFPQYSPYHQEAWNAAWISNSNVDRSNDITLSQKQLKMRELDMADSKTASKYNPNTKIGINKIPILLYAILARNKSLIKLLLQKGADPNRGECLVEACRWGDVQVVKWLIDYGINVHHPHRQCVGMVVKHNNLKLAKLLLKHGSKVNKTYRMVHPIHYAAYNNNPDMIRLLYKYGAAINTKLYVTTEWGKGGDYPIHIAIDNKSYAAVDELVALGCKTNVITADGYVPSKDKRSLILQTSK